MLHDVQLAVARIDRDGDRVADPSRKVLTLGLCLIPLAGVEAPDAGARLELRAWVHARDLELAVRALTGICSRTDIHIERSITPDREGLGPVTTGRKTRVYLLRFTRRCERSGG